MDVFGIKPERLSPLGDSRSDSAGPEEASRPLGVVSGRSRSAEDALDTLKDAGVDLGDTDYPATYALDGDISESDTDFEKSFDEEAGAEEYFIGPMTPYLKKILRRQRGNSKSEMEEKQEEELFESVRDAGEAFGVLSPEDFYTGNANNFSFAKYNFSPIPGFGSAKTLERDTKNEEQEDEAEQQQPGGGGGGGGASPGEADEGPSLRDRTAAARFAAQEEERQIYMDGAVAEVAAALARGQGYEALAEWTERIRMAGEEPALRSHLRAVADINRRLNTTGASRSGRETLLATNAKERHVNAAMATLAAWIRGRTSQSGGGRRSGPGYRQVIF